MGGQHGPHNRGTVIDRTRVDHLRHLEQDGQLGEWARDVLFDGDGLLDADVTRRLLADLAAPKIIRRVG